MNHTISNGKYTLTVSEVGAELVSAKLGDFEMLWQNNADFWDGHAPLLFPICGKIKDGRYTLGGKEYELSGHGFIGNCKFSAAYSDNNKITLVKNADAETLKAFPFDFTFTAEYEIKGDEIAASFKITNNSDKVMPYMFGWHPGFAYPDSVKCLEDLTIDFGNCEELDYHPLQHGVFVNPKSEKVKLANGKYKIDTKFLYDTDTIIFSKTNDKMTLSSDKGDYRLDFAWSENLPYLCLWKQASDDARFICLEPWSSTPNNGEDDENFDTRAMRRLPAGETESFIYTIKLVK